MLWRFFFLVVPLGAFVHRDLDHCYRLWFWVANFNNLSFDHLVSTLASGCLVAGFVCLGLVSFGFAGMLGVCDDEDGPGLDIAAFLAALVSSKQNLRILSCFLYSPQIWMQPLVLVRVLVPMVEAVLFLLLLLGPFLLWLYFYACYGVSFVIVSGE